MIPWRSTCTPTMKPGTSARNTIGSPNASQSQMKRAALSAESTNNTPAFPFRWLATPPAFRLRLVRDDPDRVAVDPREARDQLLRKQRLDLEQAARVDQTLDHAHHVERLVLLRGELALEIRTHRARRHRR